MRGKGAKVIVAALSLALMWAWGAPAFAGGRGRGAASPPPGVFKSRVEAHWFAENTRFWYRNALADGAKEFVLVVIDGDTARRQPAFDHAKLAAGLSKATGQNVAANKLPFDTIEYTADNKAVRFTVSDATWLCDLGNYECVKRPGAVTPGTVGFAVPQESSVALADGMAVEGASDAAYTSPQATQTQPATQPATGRGRGFGRGGAGGGRGTRPAIDRVTSPDGKWNAVLVSNNIVLRAADGSGKEMQLSKDGQQGFAYTFNGMAWSKDSSVLVAFRMEPGDHKIVNHIQSSPPGRNGATGGGVGRAILQEPQVYDLAGDKLDSYELNLFQIAAEKQIKPDVGRLDMQEDGVSPLPVWQRGQQGDGGYVNSPVLYQWLSDGVRFRYEKVDRGHQRLRYIEVDTRTGEARNVIDEVADGKTEHFVWTANRDGIGTMPLINNLQSEDELIYVSEMSGWRHAYLIDAKAGKVKNVIGDGNWVLRGFPARGPTGGGGFGAAAGGAGQARTGIDEQNRVLYFAAGGVYPDQDPYLVHYGHVNFDGTGLVWMTSGNGTHTIVYSPDNKYIVDSFNRVDMAGQTELRRVSDGKFMCALETTDVTVPWDKPEVFVNKGRDGTTDIWGVIYRPANIDPTKKYPIIENIYAGPQGAFVPKTFSLAPRGADAALTAMGFIVVHIDGMGTALRSKAFHEVCWHNLSDGGFLDRIPWMKAAAAKYPYMDIDRVGIFGTSAGGQNAAAAVLFHPEFYKVAVANCGCHDNRMDKATWNEQWMGYPVGSWYSACSNIDNASKLIGHLQLVVGELDSNVPPESTFRLVDALIKSRKDFELVMVPGANHGAASPITQRKLTDFFQRYLLGTEPANHNMETSAAGAP